MAMTLNEYEPLDSSYNLFGSGLFIIQVDASTTCKVSLDGRNVVVVPPGLYFAKGTLYVHKTHGTGNVSKCYSGFNLYEEPGLIQAYSTGGKTPPPKGGR